MEVSVDMPEDPEAASEGLVVFFFNAGPEPDVKVGAGMAGYGGNSRHLLGYLLVFLRTGYSCSNLFLGPWDI